LREIKVNRIKLTPKEIIVSPVLCFIIDLSVPIYDI